MLSAQLKPESDKIMERMIEVGVHHPDYPELKSRWLALVDREWNRIEVITNREQQEAILSGYEEQTARAIESISKSILGSQQPDKR